MKTFKDNWFLIFLAIVGIFVLVKSCEPKRKMVTKTEIVYKDRIDTIIKTVIKEVDKPIYIERFKTIKGKDSIIYKDAPTDNTIESKQYDTELFSNDAKAKLNIIALGEVLDVKGTIEWKQKETTTTVTNTVPMSGLFVYGSTSFFQIKKNDDIITPEFKMLQVVEAGLDYQIRNSFIFGANVSHDFNYEATYVKFKLGVRIF